MHAESGRSNWFHGFTLRDVQLLLQDLKVSDFDTSGDLYLLVDEEANLIPVTEPALYGTIMGNI